MDEKYLLSYTLRKNVNIVRASDISRGRRAPKFME